MNAESLQVLAKSNRWTDLEKEWMAAVTKRHLAAGKGDYQVKC